MQSPTEISMQAPKTVTKNMHLRQHAAPPTVTKDNHQQESPTAITNNNHQQQCHNSVTSNWIRWLHDCDLCLNLGFDSISPYPADSGFAIARVGPCLLLLPRSLILSPPPPPFPSPYPYASIYIQLPHTEISSDSTGRPVQTRRFLAAIWIETVLVHFLEWPAENSREMVP